MKSISILGCILGSLLFVTGSARAQGVGASGDIVGTVTDPSGAVIPKATVTATELERGIQHTTGANENGYYRLTGLPPTTYSVTVRASGFQTMVQKSVVVTVGVTTVVDFPMKVATSATEIEVTGEPPVIDVERGHQADTVTEQYINDLPIDRRDYLTFTLLMPGVSDSTRLADNLDFRVKQTPQSGLSFYGSNGRGNSVTVDGGEANDDAGGVRLTLSQDAVQEFQINRSNYSAELGGASGATINIVSKTGGNQVHGTLFGFFRNDALDAQDPFAFSQALKPGQAFNPMAPPPPGTPIKNSLSRQQYGGSIGFPIREDKTFIFAAFEGLRQDAQNSVPLLTNTNVFLPENDALNNQVGIINGLAGLGAATVPCLSGPVGAGVAAQLHLPPPNPVTLLPAGLCSAILNGALTINPATSPFSAFAISQMESNGGLFPYNTREYLASGRLDHHFSDQNQIFFRYSFGHDSEQSPDVQSLTGFSRGSSILAYDNLIQGAWFHQFSQFTSNEVQAQWNYNRFNVIPNVPGEVGLDITGVASLGTQIFLPSLTIMRRPEISDNLTMIRGRHTMKFGGEFLNRGNHTESHTFFPGRFGFGALPGVELSPCLTVPTNCGLPATTSAATINSIQSFAFGAPQFFEQGFGNPNYDYPRPFGAFYWQDSWKMWPNFTLNYGLRYELDAQYGPLSTDKDNFAPRVSFAWDPFKDHKTVIRGGFGIYYSPIYGQIGDVVQTLGNVNNTRQIANILIPLSGNPLNPAVSSASIFQGLFMQGLIQCTTPTPGNAACITPAALAPLGVTVSNTGPNLPPLTVIFSGQPNYQSPYSEQASIGVEREIAAGFSVSVSGIYSHTLRLPVAIDTNILPAPFVTVKLANGQMVRYRDWNSNPLLDPTGIAPCQGAAIFTCFTNPLILQSNQYSSQASALYEGGIIEVKKRFSSHYTLLMNYTYSKAYDTSTDFNSDFGPQDNTSLGAERGLSDFDQRHKFIFAAVVDSPWKGPILSGFELAPVFRYNSGHPFDLLAGSDVNGDNHPTNDRPIGAGRNTGLGPNYASFDMRLSKSIRLGEKASVQLMAEGFNLTNRTNFASVNNVVGPAFGLTPGFKTFFVHGNSNVSPTQPLGFTSAFPKREIQLGLRFSF